ncbi:MAG: DUF4091 domain-containing protein [Verrucomicrobia bacterium]|nr:DUF4091 domain-containing protein [Verrucomicrobiota bacterium]
MASSFALLFCALAIFSFPAVAVHAQHLLPTPDVKQGADQSAGFLSDRRPGYWLAETNDLGLWWCESGWKIGRERGFPDRPSDGRAKPVGVSAARGEFEPVQVILRPEQDGELLTATVGPLRDERGTDAPIEVRLDEVAYVNVTRPTDKSCVPGWYPDPLPPLRTPLALHAGQNQPLWLTFHVSRFTPAGDYRGELELKTTFGTVRVPLFVHVYDFALPEQTHLKSALGLGGGGINRYHKLTKPEDKEAVFDKYLKNFAEHRISPYSFYDYAPMDIRFTGQGTNKHAQIDFTKFDQAAAKWLDEFHFNTFQLRLRGMGGGTFHSRHLGQLEGFEEGTPEHARLFQDYLSQVERHLRERGWLNKAFTYWFDEPDPKDYAFVVDGMKRIKTAAPGIRRMLTEQPEKELLGQVEIWCGLTPKWTPENVRARRDAGEEVWWYICTGPKAPYVTEFIDHPGTELRLWPWQSWQYGVNGILIWATIYWNSSAAFPPPKLQDPWADPMSYVSGYDFKPGHVGYWGNGDGRFLYPPRRNPESSTEPNLDAPINSLRWENLRDGMEDYEYFWRLQQAIERVQARSGENELVKEARALLAVPADISKDLTHFTTDPRPILAHRERVARMIERLQLVPQVILHDAPLLQMRGAGSSAPDKPGETDCNSPAHWDGDTLYLFNSAGHPWRSSGPDLLHLTNDYRRCEYDNKVNGGRWIECTWKADDGTFYGWYHNEPGGLCAGTRLTAPKIGAVRSADNGATWRDLGIVLEASPNTLNCGTANYYFAGGNGDFSIMLDPEREWLYFFISTYAGDVSEQGVSVARMSWADRDQPGGKVFKWHDGRWREPGLGGRVTPIFPARIDWHRADADAFWGASAHWNSHLDRYVILLNRAQDKDWTQEGVYVTFNRDLSNPGGWSAPQKILGSLRKDQWYPQVLGLDKANCETDKLAGEKARLFVRGQSRWEILFQRPGE